MNELLGKVVTAALRFFLSGLLVAFVVSKLYGWFILPIGFPNLSMVQLYGITILVRYLTRSVPSYAALQLETFMLEKASLKRSIVSEYLLNAVYSLFILLIGWVAHLLL